MLRCSVYGGEEQKCYFMLRTAPHGHSFSCAYKACMAYCKQIPENLSWHAGWA